MTTTLKLETKGFAEYLEALAKMGRDIDMIADEALYNGALILQDGMKRRVPKDTYNLDKHIRLKGPEQDGNFHVVEVGIVHDSSYTDAETARYGNAQEYGTSSMGAQPYIRPTLDSDMRQARAMMRSIFQQYGIVE